MLTAVTVRKRRKWLEERKAWGADEPTKGRGFCSVQWDGEWQGSGGLLIIALVGGLRGGWSILCLPIRSNTCRTDA